MTHVNRILLVEDEPGVRLTLAANLELEGFELVEAETAEEALSLLADETVDLVLSDIRMPGMGGLGLLREVRERIPELPVVLMTAFTTEQSIDDALRAGVFTVLAKPFDTERAASLLARAVARPVVLLVEGEGARERLGEKLEATGLRTVAVETPGLALAALRGGEVDVCVAQGGDDEVVLGLVDEIRAASPEVVVVVATHSESPTFLSRLLRSGVRCVRRLDQDQLVRAIAEARGHGLHA